MHVNLHCQWVLVGVSMLAAHCAASLGAANYSGTDRLTTERMAKIVGGQILNACGTQNPRCNLPAKYLCSQYGNVSCGRTGQQIFMTTDNQFNCQGIQPNVTCNPGAGTVDCLEDYTCVWQTTTQMCVINQGLGTAPYQTNTSSCTPDCP
jgi:hypothetical protein